jgi:hypothetical protein
MSAERETVPVSRDENGRCRMHGGPSPGAPKGNQNALKHGRYTAEATAGLTIPQSLLITATEVIE